MPVTRVHPFLPPFCSTPRHTTHSGLDRALCELPCPALCLRDLVGVDRNVHAVPYLVGTVKARSEFAITWFRTVPEPDRAMPVPARVSDLQPQCKCRRQGLFCATHCVVKTAPAIYRCHRSCVSRSVYTQPVAGFRPTGGTYIGGNHSGGTGCLASPRPHTLCATW